MHSLFTEQDRERIRASVEAAEGRTSGEIVPYVVARSGRYDVAVWRGATLLSVLALLAVLLVFQWYDGWGLAWLHTGWGTAVAALASGTVGALLGAYVPAVTRRLAGEALLAETVHQRAMQAFLDEEVFATRDRTGILLFISLFEHRIEILGDAGINAQVQEDEWADIVLRLRTRIRAGQPADGMVEAVEACGHLLERRGVERRDDDTNELPNRLRLGGDEAR